MPRILRTGMIIVLNEYKTTISTGILGVLTFEENTYNVKIDSDDNPLDKDMEVENYHKPLAVPHR